MCNIFWNGILGALSWGIIVCVILVTIDLWMLRTEEKIKYLHLREMYKSHGLL